MTADRPPISTRKIQTCTSEPELRALLAGWRDRGVALDPDDMRIAREMLRRWEGRKCR